MAYYITRLDMFHKEVKVKIPTNFLKMEMLILKET